MNAFRCAGDVCKSTWTNMIYWKFWGTHLAAAIQTCPAVLWWPAKHGDLSPLCLVSQVQ